MGFNYLSWNDWKWIEMLKIACLWRQSILQEEGTSRLILRESSVILRIVSIKHHLHVCRDGAMGSSRQDGRKMMAGQKPVSKWISWMFHEWRYNCDLNLISHNLSHHALILPATFLNKIFNVIPNLQWKKKERMVSLLGHNFTKWHFSG